MIRVTVEIVPFGVSESKKILGVIDVINDGTGSEDTGHYLIVRDGVRLKEKINNFDRKRGWLGLLKKVFVKL